MPSEADALVAEGGDANLRRALELEPGRAEPAIPLARSLAAAGDREARWSCSPTCPARSRPTALATRLRLSDDPSLAAAFAALDAGETERGACDALIEAIAAGDEERKDELRKVVVGVSTRLGPADSSRWRVQRAAATWHSAYSNRRAAPPPHPDHPEACAAPGPTAAGRADRPARRAPLAYRARGRRRPPGGRRAGARAAAGA